MRVGTVTILVAIIVTSALLTLAQSTRAQVPRADAFWARTAPGPIVLDGVLDEPDWALAETKVIQWQQDAGIPGSGFKVESGLSVAPDPTVATLKLLVVGNQMYLGVVVQDQFVGGSTDFNRFDGLLMALKDHADPTASNKPPSEYFYSWWNPETTDPQPPGQLPGFAGRWAEFPPSTPRTAEQIANWDAVTVVDGLSNDDSVVDTGYTIEMRFNLTPMGYDVTQPGGDVVEWNITIYDCDGFWPISGATFTTNRVWWQSPWGNAAWYNEVRVYARPDVTTTSGALPVVAADFVVPNASGMGIPVIDGALDEPVWQMPFVPEFDIRYGDFTLRDTYPGVGPHRAGQYQPTVNGGEAFVLDPGDATIKMFHQQDKLYLGFDVRDLVVQHHINIDRWDGFIVTINDRAVRGNDQELLGRRLTFQVGPNGVAVPQDYLGTLVTAGDAEVAITLGDNTVVDTLGTSADNGYTAELSIDLTALGYPPGLGDGSLFIGINLLDGDSFTPFTDSYGTRTWWFREYPGECCPAWAYLDPESMVSDVGDNVDELDGFILHGNYPNPALQTTIRYSLREACDVTLEMFDVRGRRVRHVALGLQQAGTRETTVDGSNLGAGVFWYRLDLRVPHGASIGALSGRMLLVK